MVMMIPKDMCSIGGNFFAIWGVLAFLGLVSILLSSAVVFKWLFIDITFEKWQKKTNPDYPTPKKVRDEIVLMLKGIAFSTICPTLSIYLSSHDSYLSQAYCTFSEENIYGFQYHVAQFLGIVLVSDCYEWFYHRLGHVYKPFWEVHRHHHLFFNPSPFSVISDEFVDQFARSLPLVIFPLFVPINMELMVATYSVFFYFYGVYLHSGHEVDWILDAHHPFINTSYQHYVHHAKSVYKKPYHTGFFFKIWDQLAGSIYPDSKCDCITCQVRVNGPRTKEQFDKVVKPDYSVLWNDLSIWWGSVKNDNPHAKSTPAS
jgi:lathosterol oxidase